MNNEELRAKAEDVIRTRVAPSMELDGTSIEVLDVDQGCARVRLNGACAGCPATVMTLIMGMEQELRQHMPEIEYLEAAP